MAATTAVALAAGCAGDDGVEVGGTGDIPTTGSLLFVVEGDAQAEDGRLSIETDTVRWFTERPARQAGVSEVRELADRWVAFGLAKDPPNAAVAGGDTRTVVELSDPELDGDGVSFAYTPLDGQPQLPAGELTDASAFIDGTVGDDGSAQAGASLSCDKETVDGQQGCRFLLDSSASFTVESMAQTACEAYGLGGNCSQFTSDDTPIAVLAWGGNGGNGNSWGLYDHGPGGHGGYAQSVQLYGDVSGQDWYAYVGGGGSHKNDGGTGGMSSLVLNKPLSQTSAGDMSAVLVLAGGGGGGGPANSDGNGFHGGDGAQTWVAGDASVHGGPYSTGTDNADAFAPGASVEDKVATSFDGQKVGCGGNADPEWGGHDYACGGSIASRFNPNGTTTYWAEAGDGGQQTSVAQHSTQPPPGGANIAPVGGNAPDKTMSYINFVGGTAIDPGLATASLGSGAQGRGGGSGGGGGYGGGGGSGNNYTCGHDEGATMYCGGAGGGSYAAGSTLGSTGAPSAWYENLNGGGASQIEIWIVEESEAR